MHRVELKDNRLVPEGLYCLSFLMYRVELKAENALANYPHLLTVPNVPCGVERRAAAGGMEAGRGRS